MSAQAQFHSDPIVVRLVRPDQQAATDHRVLTLTAIGMAASVVMFLVYHQELKAQLRPDQLYTADIVKPPIYYVAHAMQIALLMAAGLVAMVSTRWQAIDRGYLFRFGLFVAAAFLMAVRGYALHDTLSTKIADSTGPLVCLISVLIFVGARPANWIFLNRLFVVSAVLFSALVLYRVAGLSSFTRQEAVGSLAGFLNALFWPASWVALKTYPPDTFARRMRFVPVLIYGAASLFTQTRLNFVMLIALFAMYAYLQRRRKAPQSAFWIVGLTLVAWSCLFTAVFLKDTSTFRKLENVTDAFASRIDEDSRSGQVVSFVESVPASELVLGRGSLATWNWGGLDWRGGTDIGYLSLLFYGGLPLLFTYIAVHLAPCIKVFRSESTQLQLTAAAVVFLWAIQLFSSSYPGVSLEYYPILFCVGACISREPLSIDPRV